MDICVNGQTCSFPEGLTIEGLLAHLEVEAEGMALERNRVIVPQSLFTTTPLYEGDQVEIIRFVGGG